jgi:hypothetical protein
MMGVQPIHQDHGLFGAVRVALRVHTQYEQNAILYIHDLNQVEKGSQCVCTNTRESVMDSKRVDKVNFRVTSEERQQLDAAAQALGLELSEMLRSVPKLLKDAGVIPLEGQKSEGEQLAT